MAPSIRTFAHQFDVIRSCRSYTALQSGWKDVAWDKTAVPEHQVERQSSSEADVQASPDLRRVTTEAGPPTVLQALGDRTARTANVA